MRVAVVTGANKGIGFAIVKQLCKEFSGTVILTARDEQKGQEAVRQLSSEGLSPTFHQLDIVSPESIEKIKKYLMEQYGGLDLLVNNAGIAFKRASTVPFPEQAIVTIQTNFHGTLNVCRALLPILKPHARDVKDGTHSQKGWSSTAYGISHLGIIALTKILARNITQDSREDILINACDPGWVCTDMAGPKATKSPEEGALTPVYAALLPINVGKPQGEFLQKKMIQEWEEMSTRSHASEAEERLKKE